MMRRPPRSTLFPTRRSSDLTRQPRVRSEGRRYVGAVLPRLRLHRRGRGGLGRRPEPPTDRKSTRLNSSHANISYAVFCLKKKSSATGNSSLYPLTELPLYDL